MQLSEFWQRMDGELGVAYSRSWACDVVLAELGGRSVVTALEQGEEAKVVWRAVAVHLELPAARR